MSEIFTEEQIKKIEEIIVKKVKDMLGIANISGVPLLKEEYRDWIGFLINNYSFFLFLINHQQWQMNS